MSKLNAVLSVVRARPNVLVVHRCPARGSVREANVTRGVLGVAPEKKKGTAVGVRRKPALPMTAVHARACCGVAVERPLVSHARGSSVSAVGVRRKPALPMTAVQGVSGFGRY
jgi:hypothetical protein